MAPAGEPMGGRSLPHACRRPPILALDMYEHSYHIDYSAKAATYVDTFMKAIRWANADRLFAAYGKSV